MRARTASARIRPGMAAPFSVSGPILRCAEPMGTPQPYAGVRRKGGWVSWRTVPTFVAGVLATLAVAVLLLCPRIRPGRVACHRPDGAVVGGGVAARGGGPGGRP